MNPMRSLVFVPLMLAACGGSGSDDPAGNTASTKAGQAVQPMNEEAALIENEALAPLPEPSANMSDGQAALPGIDAPPVAPKPQPTAAVAPDREREAAGRVVRAYYARIAKRDYEGARAMWDDDGAASGLSPEAYAKRFDRFAAFGAEVETAGRIEAGAGQRYVEVPVRVFGRMKEGDEAFERRGIVTLHRTGDIEGATPAQQRWRIASAEILPKPEPVTQGDAPRIVVARYECENGARLIARFDNAAKTVTLRRGYQKLGTMAQQPSASSIWYKSQEGLELRGKGEAGTVTLPGEAPVECRSR